ncbi:DMT family transporter [Leeia sp. TBRC 13508]|uniref:DMT family transporter n=1 Tax=Leeia speluncae TaxID=2884804 RepID=A0ABS8D253_9NEIS|nr:DMT family transporter [Leeia speluncae]MCB6182053.1 DMT family transporter [Leeia speluncae]
MSKTLSSERLGLIFILLSYLMWTLHYASAKSLTVNHSVWQILFVRSAIAIVISLVVFNRKIFTPITPRQTIILCLIGLAQFGSAGFFYVASKDMSLSLVTIAYSVSPFVVMFLSAWFLKERLNRFHYASTFIGLLGIMLANADSAHFQFWPVVFALMAGTCWGITVVSARGFKAFNPALQLLVISIVFLVLSLCFNQSQPLIRLESVKLYGLLGIEVFLAQYFFLKASRLMTASAMGPFEYSSLLWSILIDFCLFGGVPTIQIIAGAGLVVLSYFFVIKAQSTASSD